MDGVLHELLHIVNTTDADDTYHRIAVILVRNIVALHEMSITRMAKLCYVSPATLSRFFRDVGFKSFGSFKESLDRHYGFEIDYTREYRDLGSSTASKLEALRSQTLSSLADVGDTLDQRALERLAKLIHDHDKVVFFGHTVYQYVILYLQQRLSLFGKLILADTDVVRQVDEARELREEALAVICSPRGQSMVNNGVVGELYKNRVRTALITHNPNPPFAERYSLVLSMGGTPDNNLSMIALMFLVDQLVMLYYIRYHGELIV